MGSFRNAICRLLAAASVVISLCAWASPPSAGSTLLSHEELVKLFAAAQSGGPDALGPMFHTTYEWGVKKAYRIVKNQDAAEDAWMQAWHEIYPQLFGWEAASFKRQAARIVISKAYAERRNRLGIVGLPPDDLLSLPKNPALRDPTFDQAAARLVPVAEKEERTSFLAARAFIRNGVIEMRKRLAGSKLAQVFDATLEHLAHQGKNGLETLEEYLAQEVPGYAELTAAANRQQWSRIWRAATELNFPKMKSLVKDAEFVEAVQPFLREFLPKLLRK